MARSPHAHKKTQILACAKQGLDDITIRGLFPNVSPTTISRWAMPAREKTIHQHIGKIMRAHRERFDLDRGEVVWQANVILHLLGHKGIADQTALFRIEEGTQTCDVAIAMALAVVYQVLITEFLPSPSTLAED
ncbi:MAG: hypothetical protein AAGB19_03590 [Cyanobacteria bacterium P01_F01_bin.3]